MPEKKSTEKKPYKVVLPASQLKKKDCLFKCLMCCCKDLIKNKKQVEAVNINVDGIDAYYLL